MLSVILLILKIIGFIILVLVGILIFLLLIILFVPIRYRVKVEHGDAFTLDGAVSWLLHLIHGRISWSGNNRRIWLRIMGILIYDSLRSPKIKKEKPRRKKDETGKKNISTIDESKDQQLKADITRKDDITETVISSKDENSSKDEIIYRDVNSSNDEIISEKIKVSKDVIISKEEDQAYEKSHSKESVFTKGYKKIKIKIINFFIKFKNKIINLIERFLSIKNKFNLIIDFINNDINKKGFRYTYDSLRKLIKHILPRRLKSRLIFGTGDPCTTGQALGIFGILYSFYGDSLQITPDFENKVFKGSHYARGRIRIWTLLIIVVKLLLDKRFKDLRMNYQLLKEAL
ncbi:MAG: DUF2953 domain-containing protein [Anaerolineaceae bacterium]|nr:MAG: DUF2953 domain-containing protein [Anaerolineaceae bacterium]